jgi:hypothetical protein
VERIKSLTHSDGIFIVSDRVRGSKVWLENVSQNETSLSLLRESDNNEASKNLPCNQEGAALGDRL